MRDIIFRIDADQEKSGGYIFPAQDIQNLGRIYRIRSVVECEHQFFLVLGAIFSCHPFGGKAVIFFFTDQQFAVSSSGVIFPLVGPPITSSTSPSPE